MTSSSIGRTIRERRTTKDFDGRAVPRPLIEEMLELLSWAPNHRLNQPWRCRILESAAIERWLQTLTTKLPSEEITALKGAMDRVRKVGALIVVSSVKDENPSIDWENHAATAAGIQNILLFATEQGLQSYWSTGKIFSLPLSLEFFRIPASEKFLGALWLGYGSAPEAKARKPISDFSVWI